MTSDIECEDLRCRICLQSDAEELVSLFCVASTQKMLLAHMVLASTGIPISTMDQLPQLMCYECMENLDIAYSCWKRCRESWGNFKQFNIENEFKYQLCRICLKCDLGKLTSLSDFCEGQILSIGEMIRQFSGIEIIEADSFPHYICKVCLNELNIAFIFRKLCRESNETLRLQLKPSPSCDVIWNDKLHQQSSKIDVVDTIALVSNYNARNQPSSNSTSPTNVFRENTVDTKIVPPPTASTKTKLNTKPKTTGLENRMSLSDVSHKNLDQISQSIDLNSTERLSFSSAELNELMKSFERRNPQITVTRKPEPKLRGAPTDQWQMVASESILIPCQHKELSDEGRFSITKITSFKCSACRMTYAVNAIRDKCINCKLPIKNYTSIQTAKKSTNNEFQTGFRCHECNFYGVTAQSIFTHLERHDSEAYFESDKQTTSATQSKWGAVVTPIDTTADIKEEIECVIDTEGDIDPLGMASTTMNVNDEFLKIFDAPEVQTSPDSSHNPAKRISGKTGKKDVEKHPPVRKETRQKRKKFGVSKLNDDFVYR